jgi:protocatechuate 3,4-dioxygenase beta subunit
MSSATDFDPDLGLSQDLPRLLQRRTLLKIFAGGAVVALASCSSGDDDSAATPATTGTTDPATAATAAPSSTASSDSGDAGTASSAAGTTATTAAATTAASGGSRDLGDVEEIPEETAGPYPGDGSNGPNVLDDAGAVRSDIRTSVGSSEPVGGTPLTLTLTIADAASNMALAGAAVYAWHCDAEGRYSMYSPGVTEETFLRGVQETDAQGKATFTTIYPGCYSGRWPHIHFEVYSSLEDATSSARPAATSQVALPDSTNTVVYAEDLYASSVRNYEQISLARDNVFSDDQAVHQLATMSGSAADGFTAVLTVGV